MGYFFAAKVVIILHRTKKAATHHEYHFFAKDVIKSESDSSQRHKINHGVHKAAIV